jgi:protease-4
MFDRTRSVLGRVATSYVFFVVLGLVVGLVVAPVAFGVGTPSADGTVAVVPLEGTITGQSAAAVTEMLDRAREDPEVDAVVIVANSGGGLASASETLYLAAKRTAAEKPLVASVDAGAASGAYYTIAPSGYIYAKPSSVVGSVGVLATAPQELEPNDVVATTGPNKLTGGDEREFYSILESDRRAFVGSVFEQRGDRLRLSRAELSQARIYSGSQGVELGLVDAIGSRDAAVKRAAREAGLSSYRVRELRPTGFQPQFLSRGNYLASDAPEKRMVGPEFLLGGSDEVRAGTPTFLMVPASYLTSTGANRTVTAVGDGPANATASTGGDP